MDQELQETTREFSLNPEDEVTGLKLRNKLLRSGMKVAEVAEHFISIMERELKALILQQLATKKIPDTSFVERDSRFEIFESYSGHIVELPGVRLYSDDGIYCLTPEGVFEYQIGYTNDFLTLTGKIRTGSSGKSAPRLASKTEPLGIYSKFWRQALTAIERMHDIQESPVQVSSVRSTA